MSQQKVEAIKMEYEGYKADGCLFTRISDFTEHETLNSIQVHHVDVLFTLPKAFKEGRILSNYVHISYGEITTEEVWITISYDGRHKRLVSIEGLGPDRYYTYFKKTAEDYNFSKKCAKETWDNIKTKSEEKPAEDEPEEDEDDDFDLDFFDDEDDEE